MEASDDCLNFLRQTADLRFSPRWENVRDALAARGCDPQRLVLSFCDHGGADDMALWLALPDGSIVDCMVREDTAHQSSTITEWRLVDPEREPELLLASQEASKALAAEAFNVAVRSFHNCCQLLAPPRSSNTLATPPAGP